MKEQERDDSQTDADTVQPDVGRSSSSPAPVPENEVMPTDQAVSNQEQALESGEENVV